MKKREIIEKEMETLKLIVSNWYFSYRKFLDEKFVPTDTMENWEFLLKEFREEIELVLYPYIYRLYKTGWISANRKNDFINIVCYDFVRQLEKDIQNLIKENNTWWKKLKRRFKK